MIKFGSVCSGIEAASVAWQPLGWQAAWLSEIEKFPSQVLAHHYPETPNLGDMTKFKEWSSDSTINVLVGGTPCQSFSVAGLRKGLDDPRGNLMLTYLAIASKHRPQWLVWENVPGVLSSNGGLDFASLLRGMGELGYGFAYRILDAQYLGVAQRRRRVFVVGYLGNWRPAAAVLFERHSLCGYPAPSRKAGQGAAANAREGAEVGSLIPAMHSELCPSLKARDAKGPSSDGDGDGAILVPMVQPIATHDVAGTMLSRNTSGGFSNSIDHAAAGYMALQPIALAENTIGRKPENGGNGDKFTENGPMYTLNATGVHGVAQPMILMDQGGSVMNVEHDMVGTLRRETHGHEPVVIQPIAFSRNDDGRDATHNLAPTMRVAGNAGEMLAAAIGFEENFHVIKETQIAPAMTTKGYGVTQNAGGLGIRQAMAVRRLTPVECERLQGFPDGYTDIQPKGKATPDGPRYKALGNSMAVPVMAWIGKRIQAVEDVLS